MQREKFIAAMRLVANSVSVVTTDGVSGRHGATVSAFCSVSADPPTILICLNKNSKIAETVLENGQFAVNILPENSDVIAQRFAGAHDHEIADRFDGLELMNTELPKLTCATVFCCDLDRSMESGSHQIIVGSVTSVLCGNGNPLTYYNGAYHHVVANTPQRQEASA